MSPNGIASTSQIPQPARFEEAEQRDGNAIPRYVDAKEEPDSWRKKSALSFDGGGIRGYASLLMMARLMVEIGKIEHECPEIHNKPHSTSFSPYSKPPGLYARSTDTYQEGAYVYEYLPCHYFDLIVGTSTGGLIATMLGRLRMSVADCLRKYEEVGKITFENPRKISFLGFPRDKHSIGPFVNAIQNLIRELSAMPHKEGEKAPPKYSEFFSPPDLCRTIVVAIRKAKHTSGPEGDVLKGRKQDGPFLFRSYLPDQLVNETGEIPYRPARLPNYGVKTNHEIWKVCRATTAAPFYFPPQTIGKEEYCDGGAGVNNPTAEALNEMDNLHRNGLKTLASFGTGLPNYSSIFSRSWYKRVRGLVSTARASLTDCEKTHSEVRDKEELFEGERGFSYYRLNIAEGLEKVKLNEWKEKKYEGEDEKCNTLKYLRSCAERELAKPEVKAELIALAKKLVQQRRNRARDDPDRYKRFTTCVSYICNDEGCKERDENEFFLGRDMRRHILKRHPQSQESDQEQWIKEKVEDSSSLPRVPSGPF